MAQFQCNIFSQTLEMIMQYNVIIPDGTTAEAKKDMPVVYLLHGLSDNASGWVRLTSIERYARAKNCAVIMPEVQRSWYTDMKYGLRYFQFISKDLKEVARNYFGLETDRAHSYIAGLSMGGYGALKTALRCPDEFEACAGFSSAIDLQKYLDKKMFFFPGEQIAIFGEEGKLKPEDNVYELARKNAGNANNPRFYITCGTKDILYPETLALKEIMEKGGYKMEYWETVEDHTWNFWDMCIKRALDFFLDKPAEDINDIPEVNK